VNTKWIYDYGDCQDYFEFKEGGNYISYSCEIGETTFGNYLLLGDTIVINQKYVSFNKDSGRSLEQIKDKMIIKNHQLGYVGNWDKIKNDWKDNYYLQKESN